MINHYYSVVKLIKFPMTPSGIEPETFGFLAQRLNRLFHHVSAVHLTHVWSIHMAFIVSQPPNTGKGHAPSSPTRIPFKVVSQSSCKKRVICLLYLSVVSHQWNSSHAAGWYFVKFQIWDFRKNWSTRPNFLKWHKMTDIYDMIYLLTAIGLSPSGGSTHLHKNKT